MLKKCMPVILNLERISCSLDAVVPLNDVNISPRVFKTAMHVNKLERSGYLPNIAACQTIETMSQKLL